MQEDMVEGQLTLFEPVDPFTGEKMQEISPSIEGLLVNVARLVVFYSRDFSPRQVRRLIAAEQTTRYTGSFDYCNTFRKGETVRRMPVRTMAQRTGLLKRCRYSTL